jgi:urea carboxylase-associated protein 2
MSAPVDTSTPLAARDHARSMAGTAVETMPTLPARDARELPAGVEPGQVVWEETIGPGGYTSRVLARGTRLQLTDVEGDACLSLLAYNADQPIERLNVADTVKVQWNAYLRAGSLLLSDMGRVLLSIREDGSGEHDAFCGCSSERSNRARYGDGANHGPFPNARDRFLLALAKHGLGKKDLMPNINLFKGVRIGEEGGMELLAGRTRAGAAVELRAEMNVLVVLANTPHPLDDRPGYHATPVRILAWRGAPTAEDDATRNATPEGLRAFLNAEDWLTR